MLKPVRGSRCSVKDGALGVERHPAASIAAAISTTTVFMATLFALRLTRPPRRNRRE
jgi:hypothetical protein